MKDKYYKILGLSSDASPQEVKRAYRKLVLKYHPDKDPSEEAHQKFLIIQEAYEIVSGQKQIPPTKRKTYPRSNAKTDFKRHQQGGVNKNISEEEKLKRYKEAQRRYEEQKAKAFEEDERYYRRMSEGKRWNWFRLVFFTSTFMSAVFVFDYFMPTRFEQDTVVKSNKDYACKGLLGDKVMPVETLKNGKVWLDRSMYFRVLDQGLLYVEKTFWMGDVKHFWSVDNDGSWIKDESDFSATRSFPLLPILLLLPLLTYFLKAKTIMYSFLFHTSLYIYTFLLLFLLYSNDRWAHLLTLGYL